MMSDIDENIRGVKVGCYADDTRMMRGIATPHDQIQLQEQLNVIYKWVQNISMF